ncbi:DNA independent RNA polymerase I transcription factor [Lithohypha guttulata]|uniref:DNA independent RNA polymerase I transcription factor n=1 Tax=Lithohypha guttulata TaxID=1690604 RepID=UPI002DE1A215|nr:DNA independent RNA polymerase I transcription factor [Lithohypha guttulata]KAK5103159.1 DNA independent RNA polymerase I transcription factor [Lithohypha guttulata]
MAVIPPLSMRPTPPTANKLSKQSIRPANLPRRSTLKRSIDDTNLTNVPSSPSKRLRVKFDADVDIVSADEEDDLDPLVVNEQVRRALERHLAYDHESYERIRSLFTIEPGKERALSTKALRYYIQALEANVSRLRRDCGSLVQSVISSEWVGRDDAYVATFVRFLGSVAVAQGGFVNAIVGMLVDLLGPQKTRRIAECKVVRQPKIHKRVLETIKYMTQLIPLASSVLAQRISSKLDFEFRKSKDRMAFVENFMQLIHYTPEITSEILTTILRQLIKLDASIQADLDEEDDDVEDEILQHMTKSQTLAYSQRRHSSNTSSDDASNAESTEDSDSDEEEGMDPAAARKKQLKEDVGEVDKIMDTLFEYYAELTSTTNLELRDNAVEQLIAQFNSLILPTYRSRHPQFLIFHFAQADPARVDRFVTNCISILLDQKHSPMIRHAAAAYFSGFVGRGKNVSPALVHDCLDLLCQQLDEQRLKYEPGCINPDLKKYGDFYAMFQAVMYIFCFRWRDLGTSVLDAEDDDYSDLEDEQQPYALPQAIREVIHSAIYSRLNPLRICSPGIVEQFAKLTHALQLFYVYPKLEENKRVRISTSWRSVADISLSSGSDGDRNWVGENGMLEGYFPYDPYHLPISKHWIEGDYVEWQGVPGEEEEEDSDSDEDDENETEYDMLDDAGDDLESDEV